jgi:conjugative transfer signal peptidase TraF
MKVHPREVAFVALLALIALGAATLTPPQLFLINETGSVPRGLYLRQADTLPARGALVSVRPPPAAQAYLGELGAPEGQALLKRVVGVPGDEVCSDGLLVRTPMRSVARRRTDRQGHPLPHWEGCGPLAPNEVFVLGDSLLSFDSRYFGPVPANTLGARFERVWAW